ncbi:TetR/AcrR family transcriptional regulator [Lactobacillus sp. ESL0785]|uniref:TetR/AcrR family transcriptional regulator n=1 Tax=Lactobacillus sp. ESL0785 TaxID=2983232 RepID=UPI0023F9E61E|nr:TetR/AcrR family transcriptional regulator [Lactobacillus sp. ESL0785]WEV71436.1 TetR/AcrR family transcriptional regulator [Lactobacillus sp. ESL0785]
MKVTEMDRKIVSAFAKLASSYGYKGTTTRKIAEEAGINESTVFRHFPDKESILKALINHYTEEITAFGNSFTPSGDLEKDIQHAVTISLQFIEQHRGIFLIALRENHQFPELTAAIEQLLHLENKIYTDLFKKLQNCGEIAADINIKVEVNNMLLINFGHAVFRLAYADIKSELSDHEYLTQNIKTFTEHLKK